MAPKKRAPKIRPPSVISRPAKQLTQLGQKVSAPASPERAIIETVAAPLAVEGDYVARFICPEVTSLCPVTSQPDFATVIIDYVPDALLIESKSLKLFLTSLRNHQAFHETCSLMIGSRLVKAADPKWLRVGAFWAPRGGISIDVHWQTREPPKGVWIPEMPHHRGR